MNDDELKRSLESLFSDVSLPPAAPDDTDDRGDAGEPEPAEAAPGPAQPGRDGERRASPGSRAIGKPASGAVAEPNDWRPRMLRVLLYGALGVGAPVAAWNVYRATVGGQLMLIPLWLCSYLLLLLVTFVEPTSYGVKAGTFLGLLVALSLMDLVESGPGGASRMVLLSVPALTALLVSRQAGVAALLAAVATQAASAWALSTQRFVPAGGGVGLPAPAGGWWSGPLTFLLVGAGLLGAQTVVVSRLVDTLARSRRLVGNLADYEARFGGQRRELRQRALQLEAGVEVGQAVTSILDGEGLLRRTVELIPDYFGCHFAGVFLLDETGDHVVLRVGTGDAGAELAAEGFRVEVEESSAVGWTAKHRVSYVVLQADEDERYRPLPGLPPTGSEAALPLMVNRHLLGVLDVRARESAAFDETDVRVLRGLADQVAIAMENARHSPDEAALLEASSPLYRASRRLTRATRVDEVAGAVVESVAETEADGCLMVELVPSPAGQLDALRYVCSWPDGDERWPEAGTMVALGESAFPVELLGGPGTVADVRDDERLSDHARQRLAASGVGALVSIPLEVQEERIGQLVVLSLEPRSFCQSSMRLYQMLGKEAAAALQRARLLDRAEQHAQREAHRRRVVDRLRGALDVEQALRAAAGELSHTMDVPHISIELDVGPDDVGRTGN
ncbi:MAG: GAF domain-containing protein [Chloroflexota bacterium]